MKRVLITGANSYIGTSFERWASQWPQRFTVDTIDMINEKWKDTNFSLYDVVFHVAGIAHIKETIKNRDLYYKVNRDLACETAIKAKSEGVKQFIILSSMSVYGLEIGEIVKNTIPKPESNYGKSKLQADEFISRLSDINFNVAILRPPMIYGKGCKGNYNRLSYYAVKLPLFPDVKNNRSMLFVDNLSEFIGNLIETQKGGLFFPQNKEYVNTTMMVKLIAKSHGGKQIYITKFFNPIISIFKIRLLNKIFGSLVYEKADLCDYVSFEESIIKTEI